jgi:hypothetical protein
LNAADAHGHLILSVDVDSAVVRSGSNDLLAAESLVRPEPRNHRSYVTPDRFAHIIRHRSFA